jgi:hypothetical protein
VKTSAFHGRSVHRRSGDNIDSGLDFSYNGSGSVLLVLTYPQTPKVAYLCCLLTHWDASADLSLGVRLVRP